MKSFIRGFIFKGSQLAKKTQIGVLGGRQVSEEILKLAREVGREIAQKDAILICGGLGGVMEAACKGAKKAGGLTVGLLPGSSMVEANLYIDIVIPTGMGVARNAVIINACDGVIAIGGSYGTLSEMAFARQRAIPVVSLRSWQFDDTILTAESPEKAVALLFQQIENRLK
ncbi:TIGR00725 family protein [bacterium]|nr:TIGR00725 family protein [bacterium]